VDPGVERPVASDGWRGRRVRSRPALAAGLALFLLAGLGFTLAGRARSHAHQRWARATEVVRWDPPPPWTVPSPSDRRIEIATAPPTEPEARSLSAEDSAAAAPAEPGDVAGAVLPPRGRVLVLDDLATGVDGRVLAHLRVRLAEKGFRVVGEEGDASAAAGAVELLALARKAVGLGRAEEAETQAGLQAFLESAADLDAVILVSRTGEGGEHAYRVFLRASGARERP
jgi:hypothetical protein